MASKTEYLKKYLSSYDNGGGGGGGGDEGKKKKKIKVKKLKNYTIHDNDLDWKKLAPMIDDEMDDDPEEAPIVIDITGDDPETNFKWKAVKPADPVNLAIVKVEKDDNDNNRDRSSISPPRSRSSATTRKRKSSQNDSPDLSPPRARSPVDLSPPRRKVRKSIPGGQAKNTRTSRKKSPSPDLSPPRKDPPTNRTPRRESTERPNRVRLKSDQSDLSPPRHAPPPSSGRTLSGSKAGLQTGDSVKEEVLKAKAEREKFIRSLDPLVSGRNAPTVYRNKEGRKIDPTAEENPLTEEELAKKKENDLQFAQWGRGVAQVQSAHDKVADDIYEMSKPLARYRDDEDLENLLKERDREGDPMLKFLTKKKKKKKGSKEETEIDPRLNRPTYKGSWPQNRFGIPPGYRWDGINRSNGYENQRYSLKAEKEAVKEIAYKWRVEDM